MSGRGIDYVSDPYNVTFNAGETEVTLNISIIDDNILESNENFNATVNPVLLPIEVFVASNTGYATVIIVDDDGTYIYTRICILCIFYELACIWDFYIKLISVMRW